MTTVAPRAVRRIAAHAAREVDGVGGEVGAEATVDGASTTLDIRLPVAYPAPIAATVERVRAHLLGRTTELTGLSARRVDITVALSRPEQPKRRVR
ncbi:Asp23/Gls24 family envelope stress response protein [Amycolatopsis eburnea]|uniref:Asp23/Gls24 family envelope stress response protein n=1 Tax=Amycolatopsis eburnea TaxID=2267691 RepID=A0A3R9KNA8_9PSEU|nr:Asp23/Gls24 family envelope stress response protein [Amycolatopsis eburnea]